MMPLLSGGQIGEIIEQITTSPIALKGQDERVLGFQSPFSLKEPEPVPLCVMEVHLACWASVSDDASSMKPTLFLLASLLFAALATPGRLAAAEPNHALVVSSTPGLVAFWDFVKREPDQARRFTAHVPAGAATDYPLDAANYI